VRVSLRKYSGTIPALILIPMVRMAENIYDNIYQSVPIWHIYLHITLIGYRSGLESNDNAHYEPGIFCSHCHGSPLFKHLSNIQYVLEGKNKLAKLFLIREDTFFRSYY
jgi:hypothetical protein